MANPIFNQDIFACTKMPSTYPTLSLKAAKRSNPRAGAFSDFDRDCFVCTKMASTYPTLSLRAPKCPNPRSLILDTGAFLSGACTKMPSSYPTLSLKALKRSLPIKITKKNVEFTYEGAGSLNGLNFSIANALWGAYTNSGQLKVNIKCVHERSCNASLEEDGILNEINTSDGSGPSQSNEFGTVIETVRGSFGPLTYEVKLRIQKGKEEPKHSMNLLGSAQSWEFECRILLFFKTTTDQLLNLIESEAALRRGEGKGTKM